MTIDYCKLRRHNEANTSIAIMTSLLQYKSSNFSPYRGIQELFEVRSFLTFLAVQIVESKLKTPILAVLSRIKYSLTDEAFNFQQSPKLRRTLAIETAFNYF